MRGEARAPSPPDAPRPAPQSPPRAASGPAGDYDGDGDSDEDDDSLGSIVLWTAVSAVAAPFLGPKYLLGDDGTHDLHFPRFPYENQPGSMEVSPVRPKGLRNWFARVDLEYSDDFNDFDRTGSHLLFDTARRFGIDAEWNYRREDLTAGATDELWTGDANLVYRFAQNEYVQFRTGLGINWLADRGETDYGFNFTYGADIVPRRPWVISTAIDWGTLRHTSLFHGRLTVGALLGPVEVFAGYDYFDAGAADLSGPLAGLRLWF